MTSDGTLSAETLGQAVALYESADFAGAARFLAALAESAPDDAVVARLRGLAMVRAGDVAGGLAHLERAARLAPADPLAPLHYGIGLHAARRHAEAVEQFRRCRDLLPESPAPALNLAAALLELGDGAGAREAAMGAAALAPEAAETHYTLGLSEVACGATEPAMRAFSTAARLNPNLADAWVSLGVLHYQAGDVGEAARAMLQALRAKPGHAAAMVNLAVFEILQGETGRAEKRLRGVLAVDPGHAAARLNLASHLLNDREPVEALRLLAGEPPPGRRGVHWRAQRAGALLTLGRDREAEAELDAIGEEAGASEILVLWRRLILAYRAGDVERSDRLADRMAELALHGRAPLLEHLIIAHFELARYRHGRRDGEVAFDHWLHAHRLLARTQPFSRERHASFLAATLELYDEAGARGAPTSENRDSAPVFVVGLPRSGTTLVEQILSAHPEVHGAGERAALYEALSRLGEPPLSERSVRRTAAMSHQELSVAAAQYLAELRALSPKAAFIIDKMPSNALHLGFVSKLLPGARVINCVRDPRDIGLSIFQFRFFGYHPYAHDLGDLGWYIAQHGRLMDHWQAVLPLPMLTVELRDWVVDFRGTLAKALGFLGLPHHENCETFYRSDRKVRTASQEQVRQPVNARGLNRWTEYEHRLAPLIEELEAAGRLARNGKM